MLRLGSSWRAAPPEETLARARSVAKGLGIARVTEITRLDRPGVPVCVAIRPDARPGGLCVSAGKGLTVEEARVGAYMEAIEMAWAEHGRAPIEPVILPARAVLDGAMRPHAILDFCPLLGSTIDLDARIPCVPMRDLAGDETFSVPAECVLHPLAYGSGWFTTHTNGLASGNTVDEATLHALLEVVERDITSFHNVRDAGRPVAPETLPEQVRSLRDGLVAKGFTLLVRHLPNAFGLPAFMAVVFDAGQPQLTLRGDGCHLAAPVALVRAVTETFQARLSLIHGGRDDLDNVHRPLAALSVEEKERLYQQVLDALVRGREPIDFGDVADHAAPDLAGAVAFLLELLGRHGFRHVLRFVYTPPDYALQVVRIVVPGLELHSRESARVGPRLKAALRG